MSMITFGRTRQRYKNKLSLFPKDTKYVQSVYNEFKNSVHDFIKEDKFNFFLPAGIGDTLLALAYMQAFKDKYKTDIFLFVRPEHETLLKMCGFSEKNYYMSDFFKGRDILFPLPQVNSAPFPQKGEIFFLHPKCNAETSKYQSEDFNSLYTNFLRLPKGLKPSFHIIKQPNISSDAEKLLEALPGYDKCVFISQGAVSSLPMDNGFWEYLSSALIKKGYFIINNSINPKEDSILKHDSHVSNIALSLSDAIAVAYRCRYAVSLRSGLCDALAAKGTNLHIIYPDEHFHRYFSVNKMYEENLSVREYIREGKNTFKIADAILEKIC